MVEISNGGLAIRFFPLNLQVMFGAGFPSALHRYEAASFSFFTFLESGGFPEMVGGTVKRLINENWCQKGYCRLTFNYVPI